MIIQGNDPTIGPSFTLGNRVARGLWGIVWLLLFRFSPRPCHAWRCLLLRLFGAQVGNHVHIWANVRIWAPWQLRIGGHVGIGKGVNLYNMAHMDIGDYCVISQGAHLCGGSHLIDSSNFQLIAKPIQLKSHVWICADAFVGLGVTVAEGCVLGARSVTVKNIVAPWTVWAGNPVQLIRTRKVRS